MPYAVEEGDEGLCVYIVKQGRVRRRVGRKAFQPWHEAGIFQGADRALRTGIKLTEGFHLVTKKLQANGVVAGVSVYIDNPSTPGYLSRLIYKAYSLEPLIHEAAHQFFRLDCVPYGDGP